MVKDLNGIESSRQGPLLGLQRARLLRLEVHVVGEVREAGEEEEAGERKRRPGRGEENR